MSDVAIEPSGQSQGPAPQQIGGQGLLARLSDWINPILVREVQQTIKGRTFAILVHLSLIVSVLLAAWVASQDVGRQTLGRTAFGFGLMALVPLVLFVVPMNAYQSMRMELRAGIVEQLMLSRLRPRRIIFGKLAAAMVQYFLYLAVLAPVLATTYLLRGIDVPMIAWCLVFSLVFCIVATAVAVSSAATTLAPMLQPLSHLAMTVLLGGLTIGMMAAVGDGLMREIGRVMVTREWWIFVSGTLLSSVMGVWLMVVLASAQLSHAYENRSTGLRIYVLVLIAVALVWMRTALPIPAFAADFSASAFGLVVLGSGAIFFVTEQARLTPRHISTLPRNKVLRLLLVPFLPGRDRGLIFSLGILLVGGLWLASGWSAGVGTMFGAPNAERERMVRSTLVMITAYVVIYMILLRLVRGLMTETQAATNGCRVMLPFLLLIGCAVPFLFDVLIAGNNVNWHLGHVLNPFFTVHEFTRYSASTAALEQMATYLGGAAGVLILFVLPAMIGSVREVMQAASRRERESQAHE